VINGLKPFVEVVQVGDTTCGKPVGFLPTANCGTTYSAVNFESQNANGVGRYWDGLTPSCPVADDLDHALGDAAERLTATALAHVDSGACPPVASARELPQALRRAVRAPPEPGEWRGMIDR
jgi:carboxyl-terminal processing protease